MQMQPDMIERITGKEFRERLERGEDIVLVDARDQHGYDLSNFKPKGAVRIPPGSTDIESLNLPKDKLIVPV